MRWGRTVSLFALASGGILLAWAAVQGDLQVMLLFVVPVVTGTGPAAALGGLLAMAGLLGYTLTAFAPSPPSDRSFGDRREPPSSPAGDASSKSAGILLIGPIPIAWGSDRGPLLAVIVATLLLIAASLVLLLVVNP